MIGIVGLGNMGYPMAVNLLKAGYKTKVYSRNMNSVNVKDLVSRGAVPAYSPRELAEGCNTVILSLPSAEASVEVVTGRNGLHETLIPGTIIIETSTVPPRVVVELQKTLSIKEVEILDAPVSGGRARAEKGELTIMVGGKKSVFEKSLPLLNVLGKKIYYVGDLGNGELIKLLNSFLALVNLFTNRAVCSVALRSGVNFTLLHEIIVNSTGNSWIWENWVPPMIQGKLVSSTIKIALKDLTYAQELFPTQTLEWQIIENIKSCFRKFMTSDHDDISSMFKEFLEQ